MQQHIPNLYPKIEYADHLSLIPLNTTGSNYFTGSIPTEIGSLTSLTYLDFGKWCSLVLNIVGYDDCLLTTSSSTIFFLIPQNTTTDGNDFTGLIPTEIWSLTSLSYLNFCKWHATICKQSLYYDSFWCLQTFMSHQYYMYLTRLPYYKCRKILQHSTLLLDLFQLRLVLSQAWLNFALVSDVQHLVHNLVF